MFLTCRFGDVWVPPLLAYPWWGVWRQECAHHPSTGCSSRWAPSHYLFVWHHNCWSKTCQTPLLPYSFFHSDSIYRMPPVWCVRDSLPVRPHGDHVHWRYDSPRGSCAGRRWWWRLRSWGWEWRVGSFTVPIALIWNNGFEHTYHSVLRQWFTEIWKFKGLYNWFMVILCRVSSEVCLESQSEMESAQPTDDASLPSTSQEPTSSSAGTHTFNYRAYFTQA